MAGKSYWRKSLSAVKEESERRSRAQCERHRVQKELDETTFSIYWAMLMELESKVDDHDPVLKLMIEGAYRHWNKVHHSNLMPTHKKREAKNAKNTDLV